MLYWGHMIHEYMTREELSAKYYGLLKKHRDLILTEHEKTVALENVNRQLDALNEMVGQLLKDRREKNWLLAGTKDWESLADV